MMNTRFRLAYLIVLVLVLSACAHRPAPDRPVPGVSGGDAEQANDGPVVNSSKPFVEGSQSSSPGPVHRLLNAAEVHIDDSELSAAEGLLIKAQRLAPREPGLYYSFARLKVAQGKSRDAQNLLSRALSLTNKTGRYYGRILKLQSQLIGSN